MIDTKKIKRFVIPNIPYVFLWWFFAKVGEAYRLSPGRDTLRKLIGAAAIFFAVLYRKHNRKKWRKEVLRYKGWQWITT